MPPRAKIGIKGKQRLFNQVKNILHMAHEGDKEDHHGSRC